MGFPLSIAPVIRLPSIFLIAGGYAAWRFFFAKKGEMTLERKSAFATGMLLQDPAKLESLARVFDDEGLPDQAIALRKRAALVSMPPDKALTYSQVVKKALSSKNADAVDNVADQFENIGATSTAALLHEYANGLRAVQNVQPIQVTPPPQKEQPTMAEPPPQSQDSAPQSQQPFPPATD